MKKEDFKILINSLVPSRLIIALGPFIAGIILLGQQNIGLILLGLISLALADLSASALNSLTDTDSDKINKPNRLLSKNPRMKKKVAYLSIILFIFALFLSQTINNFFGLIIFLRLFFELLYSLFKFKDYFLVNHILVGITYAAIPLFASWSILIQNNHFSPIPPIFYIFIFMTIILAPMKDIEDYWGDKKRKTRTLVVILGLKKSKIIYPPFVIILSTIVFLIMNINNPLTIPPSIISLSLIILLTIISLNQFKLIQKKARIQKIFTPFATLVMVLIEFAFALII